MPLQNRVDPFGAIHAVAARGLLTGNRGVIHDPATRTLLNRRWTTRAWIVCECAFGDRRRDVMGRNGRNGNAGWTELFFLDEVTALAAGHRPCFYCRRERALSFARCFAANGEHPRRTAPEIDARLHGERRASGGGLVRLTRDDLAALPDGAMVENSARPFAKAGGRLLPWQFVGYEVGIEPEALDGPFALVTPPSTVAALKNGYRPLWHPSARP